MVQARRSRYRALPLLPPSPFSLFLFHSFFLLRARSGRRGPPSNERMQIAAMTLSVIFNTGLMASTATVRRIYPCATIGRTSLERRRRKNP